MKESYQEKVKEIPSVSIITPCRNAGPWLAETIHSVLRQTAFQKREFHFHYWIIDGASNDTTAEVVAPFLNDQIYFLSEPDRGMYDALAKGFSLIQEQSNESTAPHIVGYLNAGDILFPHVFDLLLEVFTSFEIKWVTGYYSHVNESTQITQVVKPSQFRRQFIQNGYYLFPSYPRSIQQESTFWSASLLSQIDLVELASFRLAGDYFLWREFARVEELHSLMSPLGAFRIHPGQLSENYECYLEEGKKLVRPPTWREKLTAYWDIECPDWLKGFLWNYILPSSSAKIIEYDYSQQCWRIQ
jgi:glycosyltransferase involved in cell wall biosynthesis